MYADYHIHSEFSNDSIEPIENQINKAIELGLDEICFTEHVDYGIKKDWNEENIEYVYDDYFDLTLPNTNVNYELYFETLHKLKKKYQNKIIIKQGIEEGIQVQTIDKYKDIWNRYNNELDFVLLSIHQVENKELWTQEFQKGRTQKEYNERYYQEIYDVINQYNNYSVLAHLDLIVRYDKNGRYPFDLIKDYVAEILKVAIKNNKGIEINTSSFQYELDDLQPSKDIIRLYKDLGGEIITIGSDAHSSRYLANHIKEVQVILKKEFGFKKICTYEKMNPIFNDI